MSSLFGVELPTPVNFIIAFVFVLLLIGAAAWLVRRFGATRIDAAARGRQPRLAVIDSAAVDGRRKLVIIRRDNVEHLLMIGGPTDVVVETNIVRGAAVATRDAAACAQRHRRGRAARACRCPIRRRGRCSRSPCPRRSSARAAAGPRAARRRRRHLAVRRSNSRSPPRPLPRSARCARPIRSPASPTSSAVRRRAPAPRRVQPRSQPRAALAAGRRTSPPHAQARPPTRASPRWRSASKPRCAARWRSKVVAETQRVTGHRRRQSRHARRRATAPPTPSPPSRKAISNKKWRAFWADQERLDVTRVRRLRPSRDGGGDSASAVHARARSRHQHQLRPGHRPHRARDPADRAA